MSVKELVELAAGKKAAAFETGLQEELQSRMAVALTERKREVVSEMFGVSIGSEELSESELEEMTTEELEALATELAAGE